MLRLLITSSMKSEPGFPCVRFGLLSFGDGTDAVETSAWARAVEGRCAAGARVSCARALVAPPPVAAAAPATATPVRNFRRSTLFDALFFIEVSSRVWRGHAEIWGGPTLRMPENQWLSGYQR